jgi:septation ring formation regulator EzrA
MENPNDETSLSSMEDQNEEEEDQKNEIKTDNRHSYNEAIYEQVKAQSIQLSKLTDMVESLQSEVKQLQETTRPRKRKTTSIRKKGINTKKKTKRIGSTRSKKK